MSAATLRFELTCWIRLYESTFFPLMRVNKRLRHLGGIPLVSKQTELVIEGYFRCANTFAALAFVQAQARRRVVANHTHAPASIIRAVRLGIPTLVLIREPAAVAASHVLKDPSLNLSQSLKWYSRFYSRILPHLQSFVVADFTSVTTDFAAVIREVNRRFNTDFLPFEHSVENVAKVQQRIRTTDLRLNPNQETRVSVPSEAKEQAKRNLRCELKDASLRPRLDEALAVYEHLSAACVVA